MLFIEAIAAAKRDIKLQVFASDIDEGALNTARAGFYPESIEADMAPARLASFFAKKGRSYRVMPALRETVVFTVQNFLADAPFSRIDLVSCRNLLIYLLPEVQERVSPCFISRSRRRHPLLGTAETVGGFADRVRADLRSGSGIYPSCRPRPTDEVAFAVAGPRPALALASARRADAAGADLGDLSQRCCCSRPMRRLRC